MRVVRILLLLINLISLKCASTEDQKAVGVLATETPSEIDIFSRYLDERLLHLILEYDANSRRRIGKANRNLQKLATATRIFRFYEGLSFDMPELANIWKFGVTDMRYKPALDAEKVMITELSVAVKEATVNATLDNLLLKRNVFKELAGPVLKYLIRRYYAKLDKGKLSDEDGTYRRKYLVFAVTSRLYDVFFELGKDPTVWNGKRLLDIISGSIHDSFYFDCYNNYVFNSPSASKYVWKKIAQIEPEDCVLIQSIAPGKKPVSRSELHAWIAVCIYRRVPEEEYAQYLSRIPESFLDIIKEYVYKYSPITFDSDEKDHFHGLIVNLIDKYFGDNKILERAVKFIKLLNDIRFGCVNESVYHERILTFNQVHSRQKLEMLIMAASKANNKFLVKKLAKHPALFISILFSMIETKSPHSFKVYFDMIESEPLENVIVLSERACSGLVGAIIANKFKITKTVTTNLGDLFEIESPAEYVQLGFATNYEIILSPDNFILPLRSLVEKMLNDAAKAGADELIQIITDHCGEHVTEPNFISGKRFNVSYEVIQILIKHQELFDMLANRSVQLVHTKEIANFSHVITSK